MKRQAFLAAAAMAAALVSVQPASAQQYRSYHDQHVANQQQCQTSRSNRTVGGAVVGGIIGAVLGREVADRGVRGEGALLGAVVGATAGGALGRTTAQCNQVAQGDYDPYYGRSQDSGYRGGDDDLYGGPRDDGYYAGDRYAQDCRMGEIITRDRYGREYREEAWMCRGADGVWRPE
jgi:hypothetical protein